MIIIDCEQGTPEWKAARLGIPTASEFKRIITASKGIISAGADKYAYGLIAETLLGEPLPEPPSNLFWLNRGREMEPLAIQQYEWSTDNETRKVGFIRSDDGSLGCSPDRLLVGVDIGLECKAPSAEVHMGYYLDGPGDDYRQQVQGSLLITGFECWDFYSYHPGLPEVRIRTYRDEDYIAKMRTALDAFLELRDRLLARALASGFYGAPAALAIAA